MKQRSLLDIFRIFYRRKVIILLTIVSSILTAAMLSKILPPIYEAKVFLFPSLGTRNRHTLGLTAIGDTNSYLLTSSPSRETLLFYVGMLGSDSVAQYVADSVLDWLFSIEVEAQSNMANGVISEGLRQAFNDNEIPLSDDASVSVGEKDAKWLITDRGKKYIVKEQAGRLNIYIPAKTLGQIKKSAKFGTTKYGFMKIIIRDRDPVLSARVANMFTESFNRFLQNISSQEARRIRTFSEEQLQEAHSRLIVTEEKLKTFKETHNISSIDEEVSKLVEENARLEAERRQVTVDIQENEIQLRSTEKLLAEQDKMEKYSEILADNPIVEQLRSNLVALEVQLAGVKSDYGDSHVRTVAISTQIEEARNQLKEEVEKLVVSETSRVDPVYENLTQSFVALQVTKNSLQARREALDVVIQQVKNLLRETPERSQEYARLLRDKDQSEAIYNMMALQVEDAKIEEAQESQSIVIVDAASVPKKQVFPNRVFNVLASFGFSIIASIFLCLLLEYIQEQRKSDLDRNHAVILD